MIADHDILNLMESNDLIALGDRAHTVRMQLNPEKIVSFTVSGERNPAITTELTVSGTADDLPRLHALRNTVGLRSFLVKGQKGITATEYLKALAIARICVDYIPNLEVDLERFGLKVCQVALRFGANDLGRLFGTYREEEYKSVIREAGFIPKQRDEAYQMYSLL